MKHEMTYESTEDGLGDSSVEVAALVCAACFAGLALLVCGWLVFLACLRWPWLVPALGVTGAALAAAGLARLCISNDGPAHDDGGANDGGSGHAGAAADRSAGPGGVTSVPECAERAS